MKNITCRQSAGRKSILDSTLYQLLMSLKIGDGSFVNQRKHSEPTYYLTTRSINTDYIAYKQRILERNGIHTTSFEGRSGYNSKRIQSAFRTRVEPEITIVGRMSTDIILEQLDILGLILYYLDDGSLHKNKQFMHLYCNTFNYDETEHLIDTIYRFFPNKRCSHRFDKKRDGRSFNYVYIPTSVSRVFSQYIYRFLIDNNISSLLYKVISPPQTIENIE